MSQKVIVSFDIDKGIIDKAKDNTFIGTKDLDIHQIATLYAINFNLWQHLDIGDITGFELANRVYTNWKQDNEPDYKIIRFMLSMITSFVGIEVA
jgi:predicted nuclease of predicted toxin-antitoxin system